MAPAALKDVTILVVEDNWHIANALRYILQEAGAIVLGPSRSVSEAMSEIANRKPHLVLVDYNLRHNEPSSILLEHLLHHGIRFVVLTGYKKLPDFPSPVFPVLDKPVNTAVLLEKLSALHAQESF